MVIDKSAAETNPRDQGLPSDSKKERCSICEDQEKQVYCQVQGQMLKVPLHALRL